MLLDGEWPWIERDTENLDARREPRVGATDWICEQLGYETGDSDGRIAKEEELVLSRDEDGYQSC
jgi:hypothetical protein